MAPPRESEETAAHRELVERVVRRLMSELDLSCDADDLRAYGYQGLLEAKQRFDASRGVRFSTFAYYRIRGAVLDGVRQQGWIRRSAYAKLKALEAVDGVAEASGEAHAQRPLESLAARAAEIQDTLAKVSAAYVLAAVGQEAQDSAETPEFALEHAQTSRAVQQGLLKLPEKERTLVEAVYFEGLTIEQAGARLGLSKSWASRIHGKALDRMRRALSAELGG